eukprot:gnl/TRDRNA2_/TRDRNA2_173851_c0_seq4.p1 gnl/TRDRNA2_/TRDRNA2_173851_c0~~gnl/TRDRNA2_/TRDRNA2_173851_c0_seq4.p1  ORF type:complete len:279 (-),score=40.77 gnl/TRDRNA2_/TRDRNA2_173851_c0_seq4:34-804(-)
MVHAVAAGQKTDAEEAQRGTAQYLVATQQLADEAEASAKREADAAAAMKKLEETAGVEAQTAIVAAEKDEQASAARRVDEAATAVAGNNQCHENATPKSRTRPGLRPVLHPSKLPPAPTRSSVGLLRSDVQPQSSGINRGSRSPVPNSPVKTMGPSSPVKPMGPSSPVKVIGPSSPVKVVGPSSPVFEKINKAIACSVRTPHPSNGSPPMEGKSTPAGCSPSVNRTMQANLQAKNGMGTASSRSLHTDGPLFKAFS